MNNSFGRYFVLVEGSDDGAFAQRVIAPLFCSALDVDYVDVVEWAHYPHVRRKNLVASVTAIGCDYTVLTDQDAACVSVRVEKMHTHHPYLTPSRIIVVQSEIEAWYLAGAPESMLTRLGIMGMDQTDGITKEQFQQRVISRGLDEALVKIQILAGYDCTRARQMSASFDYFLRKHAGI